MERGLNHTHMLPVPVPLAFASNQSKWTFRFVVRGSASHSQHSWFCLLHPVHSVRYCGTKALIFRGRDRCFLHRLIVGFLDVVCHYLLHL